MPLNKVRVLCPNGRRQTVQVDDNTSILLVRETVCKKQNFDAQSHELKFHKRILDDSSTLRFQSIPNNAELELVKSTRQRSVGEDSKVIVLLQTEDGQRTQKEFLQTASLWDVVTEFGHEHCAEGTQQSCRYLMKTVMGREDLQKTTLRSMGITEGRVCIRYMEVPLLRNEEQAHVVSLDLSRKVKTEAKRTSEAVVEQENVKENVVYKKEDKEEPPSITNASLESGMVSDEKKEFVHVGQDVQMKDDIPQAAEEEPLRTVEEKPVVIEDVQMKDEPAEQCTTEPVKEKEEPAEQCTTAPVKEKDEDMSVAETNNEDVNVEFLDGNGSVLLDPSLSSPSYLKWDPPDDFFEFTLADAFLLQKRLREQLIAESTLMLRGDNKRTTSKKYAMCIVRVHLPPPDQLMLQSTFLPSDRVADVISFIRGHMKHPNLDYYLFTTPPKNILNPERTLDFYDLVPSCLVHMGISSSGQDCFGSLIKEEIKSKAVSVEAYNKKVGHKESKVKVSESETSQKELSDDEVEYRSTASSSRIRSNMNRPPQNSQRDAPKWFKLGKY